MSKVSMRKIIKILILRFELKLKYRGIARSVSSVYDYVSKHKIAGICLPLPEGIIERELYNLLLFVVYYYHDGYVLYLIINNKNIVKISICHQKKDHYQEMIYKVLSIHVRQKRVSNG